MLAPRCVENDLRDALFARRRALFRDLDLVVFAVASHVLLGVGVKT